MKKSLLATAGSLALIGALTGLAAFGGTAVAATNTSVPTTEPVAITQPSNTVPAALSATPSTTVDPAQDKASGAEAQKTESDKDNINYEEQGDHQGKNGVIEKNQTPDTEKELAIEAENAGPDTDNVEVQQ